jgi:hypothetical protein
MESEWMIFWQQLIAFKKTRFYLLLMEFGNNRFTVKAERV